MTPATRNDKAPGQGRSVAIQKHSTANVTPPKPAGQCGQVLSLIRETPGILSLTLTADAAIPETAARIHDLRGMGFNIITTIHPVVIFRGIERRNVASYSFGYPEWPAPGFLDGFRPVGQLDLELGEDE